MITSSRERNGATSKNMISRSDPDTEAKVRSSIKLLNETIQNNANEPSLAFFRIQEHVRKTLPTMLQKRTELENLQEHIDGLVFDIEYSMDAVKTILNSESHFSNIQTQLEKAVFLQKQINIFRQQQIQQQLFEKRDEKLSNTNQTIVNTSWFNRKGTPSSSPAVTHGTLQRKLDVDGSLSSSFEQKHEQSLS